MVAMKIFLLVRNVAKSERRVPIKIIAVTSRRTSKSILIFGGVSLKGKIIKVCSLGVGYNV